MQKITVPQGFWFRKKKILLTFPDNWKVDYCGMTADKWRRLALSELKNAVDNPIGCERLEIIAEGKKEAIILFDDLSRPTKPYKIIPYILQKLKSAGIKKENIRFLVSSGSHGAYRLDEFKKKLGAKIVENYPVYNHNCYENTIYVGKTTAGVSLYLNKEFVLCDLRIGIGSVLPHFYCGFSGGGKIVVPGISGIKTINEFHSLGQGNLGFANYRGNLRLKTINEATKLVNFQFKIDFIVNTNGDEIACFTGDPILEFNKALKIARQAYHTPCGKNYDVVIANAYAKSNEADLGIHNVIKLLNPKKGIIILIMLNPSGQINHYLFRSYGKFIGGKQFRIRTFLKKNVKYIIFTPHKEYNGFDTFDKTELLIWKKSWNDILKIIKNEFLNPKVAVFPDATIQILNSSRD